MRFITEHVNTASQSERSPSSIWMLVDVRHAFCQFLSCCHWQDECIKADFSVSKLYNAFIRLLLFSSSYVWAYMGKKKQKSDVSSH